VANDVPPLAALLQRHIDAAHGGNQAECARALGISPQHLGALMSGKIRTPRAELRRRLCLELRVGQLRLLALTGEIDESDPELPSDPSPALAHLFALLRDPNLDDRRLADIEAVVLEAIRAAERDAGVVPHAPRGGGEMEAVGAEAHQAAPSPR
jgi:transcriptional regulator with XRE-family HTH domain